MRAEFRSGDSDSPLPAEQRRLLETVQRGALVRINVKDSVKLCELQEIVDFFGQVQQFQFAAAALRGGVSADELADAGAVNIVDVSEIEHDSSPIIIKQTADGLAQQGAALSEGNFTAEVQYSCLTSISMRCAQCHNFL
jgi:hypothetical protein